MEILIVGIASGIFYFYCMDILKRYTPLLLAFSSGLLAWAGWPASSFTFLLFIAWVPLLFLEVMVSSRRRYFGLVYLSMITWNVGTTWWIWNASAPGAVSAFLANSLLMCLPWLGYRIVKKRMGTTWGFIALIAFWMCFEYIHLHDWGLSWPWLTLGNGFAMHPDWVQWYEYTGTSGGSLWILLVNTFLYQHLQQQWGGGTGMRRYKSLVIAVVLLLAPVVLSRFIGVPKNRLSADTNIVVVQPNIDPYEKIATGTFEGQLQTLIHTSEAAMDEHTSLVLWPETALYMETPIDENHMTGNFLLNPLWGFLKRHPNLSLFTGIESFRQFDSATRYTQHINGNYYESYNGAVLLDSSGASAFYHKSKLVPGVETLPWFLHFLDRWFEKFGGTTSGYAPQDSRAVLAEKHGYQLAPAICYESIYGEFMSRFVKNGANLICIITNDGWWKNTPGYRQHMNYARLRAIETRTWVARSANTGVSCFIDTYGNVINPQPYNTKAAIKLAIPVNTPVQTFFVRYGDLLSKLMCIVAALLAGWVLGKKLLEKFFRRKFPALQTS